MNSEAIIRKKRSRRTLEIISVQQLQNNNEVVNNEEDNLNNKVNKYNSKNKKNLSKKELLNYIWITNIVAVGLIAGFLLIKEEVNRISKPHVRYEQHSEIKDFKLNNINEEKINKNN